MPDNNITPNMQLPNPIPGDSLGPQYAEDLQACLNIVDQHTHAPNSGVQITPSGLNINSDLPLNGNNLVSVNTAVFNGAATGIPQNLTIYTNGTDFFFKDSSGVVIQLTKAGGPNAGTGNIQNLPSTPIGGAGISWVNSQNTFQFFQDSGVVGSSLESGTLVVRYPGSYPTPTGNYIAIQAPNTLATGYAITLPNNAPAVSSTLTSDISGQIVYIPNTDVVNPPGMMTPYGGTVAPAGWLMCDGTSYLNATYPALFAAIGTAYGSADGSHFNVPDWQGMFLRGVDGSAGRDPDAASRTAMNPGGNTGNNVGSFQTSEFASHNHSISGNTAGIYYAASGTGIQSNAGIQTQIQNLSLSIGSTGGAETRPINGYCNYIIKT